MKLKFIVTNEADLPEDATLRGLYTQSGDKWILDIEGAVPKAQHDQFRDANVELKKKLEAFGDVTPERVQELISKENDFKAGNAKTAEQINAEVERRTAELRTTHEAEMKKHTERISKLEGDLSTQVIDRALIDAGTELGLRGSAHEDLTYRGRQQFKLDEHGKPVAIDADGNVKYGPTGEPLTPKDFVQGLTKTASHLFDPSQGSGAGGSGSGGGGGGHTGANPWKKESFNLTQQSMLLKQDPAKAKVMAAQAGVNLTIQS